MPRHTTRRRRKRGPLVPRVKVWMEADGRYMFGLGICEILQAVERTGSIKQAAADLGKSYRYVWGRIKEAEEALGLTLVEAHVGGKGKERSFLTPPARQLVAGFSAIRARMFEVVEQEFAHHFPCPDPGPDGEKP